MVCEGKGIKLNWECLVHTSMSFVHKFKNWRKATLKINKNPCYWPHFCSKSISSSPLSLPHSKIFFPIIVWS
jgi:hypothetical protein